MTKNKHNRPVKPCEVGELITVRSPHTNEVEQITVTEVRWDKWLFGGSYRVFGRVAGEDHDRLYYSERDVIESAETAGRLF